MQTILDVRFHRCPLPVLKTRKALEALPAGAVLTVIATDPAARIDMAHFCAMNGHALLSVEGAEGVLRFQVRKG
jgi:tRNA 2-thiouridine synthesizing protein A